MGVRMSRPSLGMVLVIMPSNHASAPPPRMRYFAKLAISVTPTASRTARHSAPIGPKSLLRWKDTTSSAFSPGGANQSGVSMPQLSPITAPCARIASYSGVVCCGRAAGSSSLGKRMRKRRE